MHLCTQSAGARRYVCETERLLLGLHVDVVRQTGDVERGQLSLDEGPCVSEEVFRHLGVSLVHPAQRHLLLEICDLADGVQLSGTLIGAVGDALQGHHLAGDALKRSLDSSTADLIGLGDVGAAGQVAGAALQGACVFMCLLEFKELIGGSLNFCYEMVKLNTVVRVAIRNLVFR